MIKMLSQKELTNLMYGCIAIISGISLIISIIFLVIDKIKKKNNQQNNLKWVIVSLIVCLETILIFVYLRIYDKYFVPYSSFQKSPILVLDYILSGAGIVFLISLVVSIILKILLLINEKKKGKSKEIIKIHLKRLLTIFVVLSICCLMFVIAIIIHTFADQRKP